MAVNVNTLFKGLTHARDREVWYNQKTVVAVCGLKVPIPRTVYVPLIEAGSVTCVGCRAILRERERESRNSLGRQAKLKVAR